MAGGTTIVDRLNKLSGKDATTITKALENVEEAVIGGKPGYDEETVITKVFDIDIPAEAMSSEGPAIGGIPINIPSGEYDVTVVFGSNRYTFSMSGYPIEWGAHWDEDKGGFDFSEYPFNLFVEEETSFVTVLTENPGEYHIEIRRSRSDIFIGTVKTWNHYTYDGPWPSLTFPNASEISVTFNGVNYLCEQYNMHKQGDFWRCSYGAPDIGIDLETFDFSEYPFVFNIAGSPDSSHIGLATCIEGPCVIKIDAVNTTITPTKSFKKAIKIVSDELGLTDVPDLLVANISGEVSVFANQEKWTRFMTTQLAPETFCNGYYVYVEEDDSSNSVKTMSLVSVIPINSKKIDAVFSAVIPKYEEDERTGVLIFKRLESYIVSAIIDLEALEIVNSTEVGIKTLSLNTTE